MTMPLFEKPGTKSRYGASADVMARVIEVAGEMPFTGFLQQRIFQPVGMDSTSHLPPADQQAGMARIYTQNADRGLELVESRINATIDWTPGGSGIVSTVPDYMRLGLMLRNGGELDGVRIFRADTIVQLTTPQIDGVLADRGMEGMGWALGMAVVMEQDRTPTIDRSGDYWWAGYFGTYWAMSPEADLVSVVFSQYEPGPHTDLPFVVDLSSSVAMMGL
ncbi:MAG: serine hydrolase [Gammaproteobacteria bacterium]|jgi:CubicO group peptidase (beta-lactamase class C family)|nr:serine hydrolase [Gammaproteobacteria bacterium]